MKYLSEIKADKSEKWHRHQLPLSDDMGKCERCEKVLPIELLFSAGEDAALCKSCLGEMK